ncbi:hypothetical protein V0M98_34030 (plasmid) [Pseudomonas silesiensis]|uniref:hypothetical protein n=1 Tax=Pseudomonas silesiensis TaxID=1853130 RepID=UPI0030CEA196
MSDQRLFLMDLFRRDMATVEAKPEADCESLHPAFKRDPLVFKYEHSSYLFKIWMAGRNSAGETNE